MPTGRAVMDPHRFYLFFLPFACSEEVLFRHILGVSRGHYERLRDISPTECMSIIIIFLNSVGRDAQSACRTCDGPEIRIVFDIPHPFPAPPKKKRNVCVSVCSE
uniref:Uncharacterized protein n=1 Tax=Sipha flava TaxID=143950 RepID=A0A2S2Q3K2_9HEMI